MVIYGINPIVEALRAGRVSELRVAEPVSARVHDVVRSAEHAGVRVRRVSTFDLERDARGGVHQGVVAEVIDQRPVTLHDLVTAAVPAVPLIVVLDSIEDPHNLGAILRSVDAAGASGVVRQTRHAAPLGGATAKASAGAVSHVRIAEVVNIARALEDLKEAGVWTVGLADSAETSYHEVDLTLPTALVVGAEGSGLRRLVRERCDWTVAIPMRGQVGSLNVSVATGIALFEAVRQRDLAQKRPSLIE
jgi:23S rRNA (guanosine2251-2'-O)-methyltransferase